MGRSFILKCTLSALLVALQIIYSSGYCTSSQCRFRTYDSYCCSDGTCCSYSEYTSTSNVTKYLSIGIGAIIGIVVGVIVLIVACIVGCVFCCCRPNANNPGRVITTTTAVATAQPMGMQQAAYPPGQAYPPGHAYPQGQQAYPAQGAFPPQYPTKDNAGAPQGMPPPY